MTQTKINPSNIDINEVKLYVEVKEEGPLLARVILQYKDMKIKGFRITKSDYENRFGDKLWLQAPSYRTGNYYHPMFFLETEESWKALEEKIFNAYKEARKEYYKNKFDINVSDDLDVDYIPFN